jgi:hypothetical protein
MRTAIIAALACVVSWIGLWIGAGYIGLSRSVAVSPLTLVEVPLALAVASAVAFVIAWLPGRLDPASAPRPAWLLGGVLIGDVFGAAVLAPLLIGELEVIHAPIVFAAITALGLQPLAALLGAWLSRTRDARA